MTENAEPQVSPASSAPTPAPIHIKCVLVGDNSVGKTSLLIRYTNNIFVEPGQYLPNVFDNYVQDLGKYHLALWDTHVLEEHDFLRARSYPDTSILLVCFSVVKRVSFENVRDRWLPEISAACPGTPWVLVGMQTDLRDGSDEEAQKWREERERSEFYRRFNVPVTAEEGRKMARKLGASGYVECSARKGEGDGGNVNGVFEEAILASQRPKPEIKKKRDCVII
ncbi:P-loop containing nucleoside triphosphate hydrolase protein [Aspergillus carlsbadensis]|nr:P-loop containing nucleoside triphosphate hydrolase protein [Aspergillus carlsbadensis]